MDESLTEQRRVSEEGLRIVKLCCQGRTLGGVTAIKVTVLEKKAPANYVPAAAVIRRGQALSGIIGRKARAGGFLSLLSKARAQPVFAGETVGLECRRGKWNSTCSGEMRRDVEEHQWRRRLSGL
jgi:hypothetical protein